MSDWWTSLDHAALRSVALAWTLRVAVALAIFWIGRWLAGRLSALLGRTLQRAGSDAMLADFVRNIAFGLMLAVVVVAVLDQLGVPSASLLAALGAAGLAIGLALQGSLSNIASGVLLIVFRPFRAGDFVEVAGQGGTVESLGLLFTRLRTPDNRDVHIPNSQVMAGPILNVSARGQRRIDLLIGVAYEADPARAMQLIRAVLDADPRVLREPEPAILVMNLGASSVDLAVRPWVASADYWTVRSDLMQRIKQALEAAGIEIPFPQTTLHIRPADRSAAPLEPSA